MGMLEIAQGKFSNAWVAVYRDKNNCVYYGYGNTREEAKDEVLCKIPMNEIETAMSSVTTRETHRQHAA